MKGDYLVISLYVQYDDIIFNSVKFNDYHEAKAEFDKLCIQDQHDEVLFIHGSIMETN